MERRAESAGHGFLFAGAYSTLFHLNRLTASPLVSYTLFIVNPIEPIAPVIKPIGNDNDGAEFVYDPDGSPLRVPIPANDPNDLPTSLLGAAFVWAISVVLLVAMSTLLVIPYALRNFKGTGSEALKLFLLTDKTAILLQILAVIPAHLLTLGVAWAMVTRFGKRPFWQTIRWKWGRKTDWWAAAASAAAAGGLLIIAVLVTRFFGSGQDTDVDKIIASSSASRYAVALLAVLTAPLVEEIIYRGLLYPAVERAMGMIPAILLVSALFTFVHVFQYSNNLGVVAAIALLSLALTLTRAYTKSLLPCFVMHFVFNGLQSASIILQQPTTTVEPPVQSFVVLARIARLLI